MSIKLILFDSILRSNERTIDWAAQDDDQDHENEEEEEDERRKMRKKWREKWKSSKELEEFGWKASLFGVDCELIKWPTQS